MKKTLSVALIAAVLLSAFAGCSITPRKKTALTVGQAEIEF